MATQTLLAFLTVMSKHRKRTTEEKKENEIRAMTQALAKPRQIQSSLRNMNPSNNIDIKDIHNERFAHKKEKLGGLTPVQALLRDLDEYNAKQSAEADRYLQEFTLDSENRVDFLFFAHPLSLKMLRKSNEVLGSTTRSHSYH